MYHGTVQKLAETVSKSISREGLVRPGDRVGLAVSGGADSVALLRLFLELRQELGMLLAVVHFNHKLRGNDSEADENFVSGLSQRHGLEFLCGSGNAALHAKEKHMSLEAAARFLRHGFFSTVLREGRLNRIATAHTLDDQAETVLLKLVRGAGTRGLAGIYPMLAVDQAYPGEPHSSECWKSIIRPLLSVRRKDIETYLESVEQTWREDKSNRDLRHSRNVVRHGILPRLERNLNPAVREVLAESAEIARGEEEYWRARVADAMPGVLKCSDSSGVGGTLDARILSALPKALRRRVIRAHAESLGFRLEFRHVEQVLRLSSDYQHPQSLFLGEGWKVCRTGDAIRFQRSSTQVGWDYEYRLPIPGQIAVPEADRLIEAALVRPGVESGYNLDHAIDPGLIAKELQVRNWRPGDRFWPGHNKSQKKIKELLQGRHVAGVDRKLVPVVVSGSEVIWLGGFPVPAALRPQDPKREAVVILEKVLSAVRLMNQEL